MAGEEAAAGVAPEREHVHTLTPARRRWDRLVQQAIDDALRSGGGCSGGAGRPLASGGGGQRRPPLRLRPLLAAVSEVPLPTTANAHHHQVTS